MKSFLERPSETFPRMLLYMNNIWKPEIQKVYISTLENDRDIAFDE